MKIYKRWAEREYSPQQRSSALLIEAIFFVILLPVLLYLVSTILDSRLRLPRLTLGWGNLILGILLITAGWPLALWSIWMQLTKANGTPVPVMPTHSLLESGPFALCRNPMTLGTILAYLGLAIALGSYSAIACVFLGAAILITYIKTIEEKELEARFGEAYRAYKQRVPFMLPRFR